jgi:hypothetical protein
MTDSLALPTTRSTSLVSMAGIEARRLARSPIFLGGVVLAFGLLTLLFVLNEDPAFTDLLATPIIAAFFIGLPSLVTTARLTRSTEAAAEAMGTAPGTEAQRTLAVAIACGVPFGAGLLFTAYELVLAQVAGVADQEWWFGTMPDWQVWSILLATSAVPCLGAALLGVLTGRWLDFPGASAVVVVAVVAISFGGGVPLASGDSSELRLWVPWAMWHSGTLEDGTARLSAGNPAFYLAYVLCLCAAAVLGAVWHDRTARTGGLRMAMTAVVVVGLACLALAMTTGNEDNRVSDPIPFKIDS